MPRSARFILSLAIVFACAGAALRADDDVLARRAALYAEYGQQLEDLAAWCQEGELPDAAAQLRGWLPKREPDQLTLFVLPPSTTSADKSDKSPEADWQKRWQTLRNEQAEALFDLARRAVDQRHPSLAFELVTEAVRENPDHAAGRRLLGYIQYRDGWHTPFEVRQIAGGKVCHEQFGWLPKAHLERYEQGRRYYQGRWMPADEEAKLRADLARGWRVESTHYVVTTNHSLEEGVRLSRQLEQLYSIWRQVFGSYIADAAELKRRFRGRAPRTARKRHNVVFFRTRDQYNEALRPAQPRIDISLGIYLEQTRAAYFFAGDEQDPGTIFHEATHQLFLETRPVVPNAGRDDNFWIVEGIACHMESLADRGGYFTLGGANAGRMPAARHRLLEDEYYVPLAELVQLGMEPLQGDPRLPRIYSQSAGLANFLMHDGGGRYREALTDYLVAVYTGRATPRTLAELTGVDYGTLDRRYAAFMSDPLPAATTGDVAPRVGAAREPDTTSK